MKRRSFLFGLAALLPTTAFASNLPHSIAASTVSRSDYILNNYPTMIRVVDSFPKITSGGQGLYRANFLNVKRNDNNQFGLTIKAQVVDTNQNYTLDKIFMEDDIEVLDYLDREHTVSAIVSGANRVAKKTSRGKGNHYAVFEDHVLIWFRGKASDYDTPVQMIGNNLAYNDNYKDYFVKVKCKRLTDDDHKHLERIGYTRV